MSEETHKQEPENDAPEDGAKKPRRPKRRLKDRPGLVGLILLVVIAATVGGVLWWRHARKYESTEDAYVDARAQRVSARVAGRVARVLAEDNEDVTAGQVLVELDPADFQNRVDEAQAAEAQARAQLANTEARRAVAEAQHEQAQASAGVAEANARNAAEELRRFQGLRAASKGAVTDEQLDRAQAAAASSAAQVRAAHKAVAAAEAEVTDAARAIDAARAGMRSAGVRVAEAKLTLSYAQVTAQIAGRVARKTVAPGNYVTPGEPLMAVVPHEVYVTANFKETQLARMLPGQPVKVKVDAFPDLKLRGRIDSVQPATGQAFDVLPAQNVSGNWVKVVQRLPVKITLDQLPADPKRLAPGMSVEVTVDVSGAKNPGQTKAAE
ncbi:MAG TPA: HlyD family secretion protein [Opitutus sp.]|nr:HlyD family secretion protein [Opitutus sp.]